MASTLYFLQKCFVDIRNDIRYYIPNTFYTVSDLY